MTLFESKSLKERKRILWNAVSSQKVILKYALASFTGISIMYVIVTIAMLSRGEEFSTEFGSPPLFMWFFYLFGTFVLGCLIMFPSWYLNFFVLCNRLVKKYTYAEIMITPDTITLRKDDGVETIINQDDIQKIYFLDMKEKKELMYKGTRYLNKDIDLSVLKIETNNSQNYIIMDVYKEDKLLIKELNTMFKVGNLNEFMDEIEIAIL